MLPRHGNVNSGRRSTNPLDSERLISGVGQQHHPFVRVLWVFLRLERPRRYASMISSDVCSIPNAFHRAVVRDESRPAQAFLRPQSMRVEAAMTSSSPTTSTKMKISSSGYSSRFDVGISLRRTRPLDVRLRKEFLNNMRTISRPSKTPSVLSRMHACSSSVLKLTALEAYR